MHHLSLIIQYITKKTNNEKSIMQHNSFVWLPLESVLSLPTVAPRSPPVESKSFSYILNKTSKQNNKKHVTLRKEIPLQLTKCSFPCFFKISKTKIISEKKLSKKNFHSFFFLFFSQFFFTVYPVLFLPQAKAKCKQKRHF